tara:strand:+ start:1317 stop:1775 length:459 start_codon:yes stop_codon:yes gene_type:complete
MAKGSGYLSKFPVKSSQLRPANMMKPSSAVEICFREKYFDFTGRSSRSEFWFFLMFNIFFVSIINAVLLYVGSLFGIWGGLISSVLSLIVSVIFVLPLLSVSARRLHDVGKSGWFVLILLIPLLGLYLLIKAYANEGETTINYYGRLPINQV